MKSIRITTALLCLLMLSACASLLRPQLEKPRIDVVNIEVLDLGLFQQRYLLTLNVQNPNNRAIPIRGMSYDLDVAGARFARGVTNKAFELPAYGETEVEVEMTTNLASAAGRARALLEDNLESLDYKLSGKLEVPTFGAIPFTNTGEIRLAP